MATLLDNPEFTSNEIYEILATDAVEGAASGASFAGIGISNQPHQQLANRTAFLKQRQDTNISNINVLLAFMAKFAGSLQQNGYLEIPITDVTRGSVSGILQWGFQAGGAGTGPGADEDFPYSGHASVVFPIGFPNQCLNVLVTTVQGIQLEKVTLQQNSLTRSGMTLQFYSEDVALPDCYWIAIGF